MVVYVFVRTGRETTLSAARFTVTPTAQFWRSTTRRHKLRVSFASFSPRGIGCSRLLRKSLIEGRLVVGRSLLCSLCGCRSGVYSAHFYSLGRRQGPFSEIAVS